LIADGAVFIDINQDGALNEDEISTTTAASGIFSFDFSSEQFQSLDSNGNGQLDPNEGTLVLDSNSGTTDLATGASFETKLMAPANATVITPLTTLVSELMQQGREFSQAQSTVKTAFGISEQINLTSFDPILQANQGNPLATSVFAGGVRVQNTVTQIANFLNGISGESVSALGLPIFGSIAQQLTQSDFDLTQASTLETVIQNAASNANLSLSEAQQGAIGTVADIIAAGQQRIASLDTEDPQAFLKQATQIQKVSQGNVADALQGVGSNPDTAAEVAEQNTGQNLDSQIDSAQTGNIAPPQVQDIAFTVSQDLANGDPIGTVPASDVDGDPLAFGITSGNPNPDGNDTAALAIANDGQLTVADRDDLNLSDGTNPTLTVRATEANRDGDAALSDSATVTLATEASASNTPPQQQFPLADRTVAAGESFEFALPQQAFRDPDAGDSLSYSVSTPGEGELPEWLSFNAEDRSFSGTPSSSDTGSSEVQVTAQDSDGATASDTFQLTVSEAETTFSLDVDGNGQADALTDGILAVRYLFGFRGAELTAGALGQGATRQDPAAIADYLGKAGQAMDIDGNGQADALTDGILMTRALFGFQGQTLTQGALGEGAQRTQPSVIAERVAQYRPANSGSAQAQAQELQAASEDLSHQIPELAPQAGGSKQAESPVGVASSLAPAEPSQEQHPEETPAEIA